MLHASINWVVTGSGNVLSPIQHQAIPWTYIGLLSIGRQEQTSVKFKSKYKYLP